MSAAVLPRVTTILAEAGLAPDYSMVDPVIMAAAQERGTALHAAIELHAYGVLDEDDLSPGIAPYLDAYKKFLAESRHTAIGTEVEVVHPSWNYVGHLDRVGWLNSRRAILDFKTPEQVDLKSAGYQLAGYRMAWNAMHPTEPVEITGVLQLRSDGTYRWHDIPAAKFEDVFLAAVLIYRARKER